MFEGRTEQDAALILKNLLRPVAVMNIEVHDRNPLETVCLQRMRGTHGNVVEQAKPHRPRALGVMPRWPGTTERRLDFTAHDEINGGHN